MTVHCLIVEDHPLTRGGIAAAIAANDGLDVWGVAASVASVPSRSPGPDAIITDLRLPGSPGVSAVESLRAMWPSAKILVLTASERAADVARAFEAGADGYATKAATDEEVVEAIRCVTTGRLYLSPTLCGLVLAEDARFPLDRRLSTQEAAVIRGLADGLQHKEIASSLGVSIHTVRTYLKRIQEKTGRRKPAEMALLADELVQEPREPLAAPTDVDPSGVAAVLMRLKRSRSQGA